MRSRFRPSEPYAATRYHHVSYHTIGCVRELEPFSHGVDDDGTTLYLLGAKSAVRVCPSPNLRPRSNCYNSAETDRNVASRNWTRSYAYSRFRASAR